MRHISDVVKRNMGQARDKAEAGEGDACMLLMIWRVCRSYGLIILWAYLVMYEATHGARR